MSYAMGATVATLQVVGVTALCIAFPPLGAVLLIANAGYAAGHFAYGLSEGHSPKRALTDTFEDVSGYRMYAQGTGGVDADGSALSEYEQGYRTVAGGAAMVGWMFAGARGLGRMGGGGGFAFGPSTGSNPAFAVAFAPAGAGARVGPGAGMGGVLLAAMADGGPQGQQPGDGGPAGLPSAASRGGNPHRVSDPAPKVYKRHSPGKVIVEHRLSRALARIFGGNAHAKSNLYRGAWEMNSRKGAREGRLLRDYYELRAQLQAHGYTPKQARDVAREVLRPQLEWIMNDVHPRPLDSAALDAIPVGGR